MSVEHGEARNDRAGQVTAETVVYRPPAVLRPFVERDPETVLICDGGEFAQWAQSLLPVGRRRR